MPPESQLKDRCALITGATSGIGLATTKRLLAAGSKVIATGRRIERLNELASGSSDCCHVQVLDVMDVEAVAALPDALPHDFAPDIVVNNAGLALGLEGASEASLSDWDRMIATNVRGLVHLTRAFLPRLVELPRADVINISSVSGTYPYPGSNVYGATKAFVTQFSVNLRADLLGTRVRVTSVEPGMTNTEFSTVRFAGNQEKADAVYRGVDALGGEDIAEIVANILALPPHVNVNRIEVMPVQQAFGPFAVQR